MNRTVVRICTNLLSLSAIVITSSSAPAAVTVLGVQYQQDNPYTEYQCIWHDRNYPTSCGSVVTGCNVHVYLKNTGTTSVNVSDVIMLGQYNLSTVIKEKSVNQRGNSVDASSIYFYWDNPPQALLDAGEPVWFKCDPKVLPAGGVGQVVVRLRSVPVTRPVSLGIVTSIGTINASIPVDANAPVLASVGFSQDRMKVYMHWRRSNGAAPSTIWMDGNDVTASTVTVGDAGVNFASSVLTLAAPLTPWSYHVFQGQYADGKVASASLHTWAHEFIYSTWYTFDIDNDAQAQAWIDDCTNRGINAVENQMPGALSSYLSSGSGKAYAASRGFGAISWNAPVGYNPIAWFLEDEPDAIEGTIDCGNGLQLPCGSGHNNGVLCMPNIQKGEQWGNYSPNIPTTVNLDATLKPDNYYSWGQAVDWLSVDAYYQKRLEDAYYKNSAFIPLYRKAYPYIYAISLALATAAEPNPTHFLLYSNQTDHFPYPQRACKRMEAYYALAGGSKGIGYWWFKKPDGLATQTSDALDLWEEIGLLGCEFKTVSPQLLTSHPVAMTLTPSTNVWARALASGTDTMILLAVNDNYYNDKTGLHNTPTSGATVTATLPSWMRSPTPTAFEVTASGLVNVTTSLNGSQFLVNLGTLNLTRMIVITTNPQLRTIVQQRYEEKVWPGICTFAPNYCLPQQNPPSIVQDPSNQMAAPGDTASFTVVAAGSSPLSFRWQKNNANLSDGGHYSGCTTVTLNVSPVDSNDAASYRCVVTNPYGNATSNSATLTLGAPVPPSITQQPSNQAVMPGGTATLRITATGSSPLTYQWQKNLMNLANGGHYSGATTANLTITGADGNDVASYRCVVTNPYGTATSDPATFTVASCTTPTVANGNFEGGNTGGVATGWTAYSRPTVPSFINYTIQTAGAPEGLLYQQIQSSYVASGGAGIYQVVTGCTAGASYRIRGSFRTNSGFGRASVKVAPNGSTSYSDAIDLTPAASTVSSTWSTFDGTVTATASSITVFLDAQTWQSVTGDGKVGAFDNITVVCTSGASPLITQQPGDKSVCTGTQVTFNVSASGDAPLSYQWQKNQANLGNGGHYSGTTTAVLTITGTNAADAADYRCVVTNTAGNAISNTASLTIKAPTAISVQPASQIVCSGTDMAFTITAGGDGTLDYQWQKNQSDLSDGGHVSGANTSMLSLAAVDANDAGSYSCVVTGDCGTVPSDTVSLSLKVIVGPDLNADCSVDQTDFELFVGCVTGAGIPYGPTLPPACTLTLDNGIIAADSDHDHDVDMDDFAIFQRCYSGTQNSPDPNCAN